jgi:hypothetical protein
VTLRKIQQLFLVYGISQLCDPLFGLICLEKLTSFFKIGSQGVHLFTAA